MPPDRPRLAAVLRRAREAVRPEDVGLAAGSRRRVPGLRREELALLAGISVDYVVRLEQGRGPQPSTQVLDALARALRLDVDARDELFRLAGSPPPEQGTVDVHVRPSVRGSSTGSPTCPRWSRAPRVTCSPGTPCRRRCRGTGPAFGPSSVTSPACGSCPTPSASG